MRSISLSKMIIVSGGQKAEITYAEMIKLLAEQGSGEGFSLDQLRQSIHLIQAVEDADDHLLLEEATYQILVALLRSFKWKIASPAIGVFVDTILNAPIIKAVAASQTE